MPCYANHSDPVVAYSAYCSGHMRAVSRVRGHENSIVAFDQIPTVDIVNESVAIIVNAVAGNLARVHPCVRREVRVREVYARVYYGNHKIVAARSNIPSSRRGDICGRLPLNYRLRRGI